MKSCAGGSFYVSDDRLYSVLDSGRSGTVALLPQSGISNLAGAGFISVRVQSFLQIEKERQKIRLL